MSKGTICITGATGYVGFATLLEALRNDYNCRIVVRSDSKATVIKTAPAFLELNKSSACSFYTVPDLSAPGALDEAIKGVDYVIHMASPLPFGGEVPPEEQYNKYVVPALTCTLAALESASKSPSVKRVVITSSVGSYIMPDVLLGPDQPSLLTITEEDVNEDIPAPFSHPLTAYCASKTAAMRRSLEWMAERKPSFDLVNIAPSYVQGRHGLAQNMADLTASSTVLFIRMFAGLAKNADAPPEVAAVCHIDDAASVHVRALDRNTVPGNQSYLFSQHYNWNDVLPVVAAKYPEQVKAGLLPNDSNVPSKKVRFSAEKGQRTFGIKLKGIEEMVDSIVPQYLEMLEKEKKLEKATAVAV
ncbi:uncharacterized protein K452DRAFT_226617 [Aplosporella prunicola CBS 121167]|uniref:NAD-dependent epimerase/dehydratase domain-containing protein n=1 Tax=Aplosporella prunicola CBS 121167 TaxID=1176127 RepID=A0A6A6BGD3_9PEZI|nr:uncharacterized protein K452DRAFT_226617 [Aplosporella prunicola CBS 121167]KAF2142638.1 hypothetical protein K452DRAFT_226617 [Aplosporella prunicola CBS 121167]